VAAAAARVLVELVMLVAVVVEQYTRSVRFEDGLELYVAIVDY